MKFEHKIPFDGVGKYRLNNGQIVNLDTDIRCRPYDSIMPYPETITSWMWESDGTINGLDFEDHSHLFLAEKLSEELPKEFKLNFKNEEEFNEIQKILLDNDHEWLVNKKEAVNYSDYKNYKFIQVVNKILSVSRHDKYKDISIEELKQRLNYKEKDMKELIESYIINFETEEESKKIQGILFELGYKWMDTGATYQKLHHNNIGASLDKSLTHNCIKDERKQINLSQLEKLVGKTSEILIDGFGLYKLSNTVSVYIDKDGYHCNHEGVKYTSQKEPTWNLDGTAKNGISCCPVIEKIKSIDLESNKKVIIDGDGEYELESGFHFYINSDGYCVIPKSYEVHTNSKWGKFGEAINSNSNVIRKIRSMDFEKLRKENLEKTMYPTDTKPTKPNLITKEEKTMNPIKATKNWLSVPARNFAKATNWTLQHMVFLGLVLGIPAGTYYAMPTIKNAYQTVKSIKIVWPENEAGLKIESQEEEFILTKETE